MLNKLTWCEEHNCPLVRVGVGYECVVERVGAHLMDKQVQDIIPASDRTPITLVFHDGHTLPLFCPDCGDALHVAAEQEDKFLEEFAGLYVIGVAYLEPGAAEDNSPEMIALAFGQQPGLNPEVSDVVMQELYLHLESARRLTCPGERRKLPRRGTDNKRRRAP